MTLPTPLITSSPERIGAPRPRRNPSGPQAEGDSIKAAGRAKAITAEAEAQARGNHLLAESITPTLVQYEMAKRWNGQMPQVTGSAVPMIQLPK